MADDDVLLRCQALEVGWQKRALLPPIDCAVRRGRFLAVVGRNGAGKSTWFKTLLGLTPPIRGAIVRPKPDLRLAYVPQSASIDPMLPIHAWDVVMMGRLGARSSFRPFSGREDQRVCASAFEQAEAKGLEKARFFELSKGQRQRVLFARMLASEPELALLDEPTAAMDLVAERRALDMLTELSRERDIAVVLVSHSVEAATEHADDILLLDRNEGLARFGPRDEIVATEGYLRHYGPCVHGAQA